MNNNEGIINPRELQIQGLLDSYLRANSSSKISTQTNHLDEDSLTAFVEGNLSERENKPIMNHLINCSFCRHITAEIIKLDLELAEDIQPTPTSTNEPTKVSEVLNGILSRIFGTSDDAVFAHQESKKDTEETGKSEEEE